MMIIKSLNKMRQILSDLKNPKHERIIKSHLKKRCLTFANGCRIVLLQSFFTPTLQCSSCCSVCFSDVRLQNQSEPPYMPLPPCGLHGSCQCHSFGTARLSSVAYSVWLLAVCLLPDWLLRRISVYFSDCRADFSRESFGRQFVENQTWPLDVASVLWGHMIVSGSGSVSS